MRSWTTFIIFGAILLALIIIYGISQITVNSDPVMHTSQLFLDAVKKNDASAAEALIDPSMGRISKAGNKILSVSFKETSSIVNAAFNKKEPISWDYLELSSLALDLNIKPVVLDNNLAGAPLQFGQKIYLRRIGNDWKIFYIARSPGH